MTQDLDLRSRNYKLKMKVEGRYRMTQAQSPSDKFL